MKKLISLGRLFDHRLGWVNWKLVLFRIAVNGLGGFEAIVLPLMVSPGVYSSIEALKQIYNLMPAVLFGSNLGYLRNRFVDSSDDLLKNYINGSIFVAVICASVISVVTGELLIAVIAVGIIAATVVEKELVVQNKIVLASSFKPIISALVIVFAGFNFYTESHFKSEYLFTVFGGILLWLLLIRRFIKYTFKDLIHFKLNELGVFFQLVKKGFMSSMCTYMFGGHMIVDRGVVSKYYGDFINGYSLAFTFSQICSAVVATIAVSYQFEIGSIIKSLNRARYAGMRNRVVLLGVIINCLSCPLVFIYSLITHGYDGFFSTFIILSILNGFYFALSASSVVAIFLDMSGLVFCVYLLEFVINLLMSPVFGFEFGYYFYVAKSGLSLVFTAIFIDRIIFSRLPNVGED